MPKQHDPGGKVRIALTLDVESKTVSGGPGDCYRYRLSRTWDEKKPHAMFVIMNPSTADLLVDDSTVAKCGRFARAWGYGGIYVGNTFAYRATNRKHLRLVADPSAPIVTSTLSLWRWPRISSYSPTDSQVTEFWCRAGSMLPTCSLRRPESRPTY
jgi:Protein of unknown function (DUF1643)